MLFSSLFLFQTCTALSEEFSFSAHRYFCLKGTSLHPHFVLHLVSLSFFLLSSSGANLKYKALLLCVLLALSLPILTTSDLFWPCLPVLAVECCSIRCIKFNFHFPYIQHQQLISLTGAISFGGVLHFPQHQARSCPLPFYITKEAASR